MGRYWLKFSLLFVVIINSYNVFSQNSEDGSENKTKVDAHLARGDSTLNGVLNGKDLPLNVHDINNHKDSIEILLKLREADSLAADFHYRSDSLQAAYHKRVQVLDSVKSKLRSRLKNSTAISTHEKLKNSLDSVTNITERTKRKFESDIQSLNDSIKAKLGGKLPTAVQERMDAVRSIIDPSGTVRKIPNLNNSVELPGNSSGLEDLPLTKEISIPNVGDGQTGIDEKLPDTDQIGNSVNSEIPTAKSVSDVAEQKAVELSKIKEIQDQTTGIAEYEGFSEKIKNQDAIKEEAMVKARKVATNHFAGKEEQLKAAMEKMAKYKQKYSNMNGLKDLASRKKRHSDLHDKTFAERIVPGTSIQIQRRGNNVLVDFNPYVGYRFSSKLRGGVGWNQRLAYGLNNYRFQPGARIFGPRTYGEFKLGRGFSPRLEFEFMNTQVPPFTSATDPEKREWVFGAFAGMKKEYKLYKKIKGTVMIMARLYNLDHKSPYADVINMRIGFEIVTKKKLKKEN